MIRIILFCQLAELIILRYSSSPTTTGSVRVTADYILRSSNSSPLVFKREGGGIELSQVSTLSQNDYRHFIFTTLLAGAVFSAAGLDLTAHIVNLHHAAFHFILIQVVVYVCAEFC